MTTTLALLLILAISMLTIAAAAPLTWELRRELATAKARTANYAAIGVLLLVCRIGTLVLWWYVAATTHLWVLGVIPTVAGVWAAVTNALTKASKAQALATPEYSARR